MNVTRKLPWLLVLLVTLALVAAGCGGDDDDEATTPRGQARPTRRPGEAISVGMVSDTGGLDDRGFNEFSIAGFERAASRARRRGPRATSPSRATTTCRT